MGRIRATGPAATRPALMEAATMNVQPSGKGRRPALVGIWGMGIDVTTQKDATGAFAFVLSMKPRGDGVSWCARTLGCAL